jgi:PhnB protein
MATRLNPYLGFADTARPAMEFYQRVFGGELAVNTFADFGQGDAAVGDLIMHAQLETPSGFTLMASDTPPGMTRTEGDNLAVSVSGDDADELRGYWEALSSSGKVTIPLQQQVWGDEFGMCTDQFGVQWMVSIAGAAQS